MSARTIQPQTGNRYPQVPEQPVVGLKSDLQDPQQTARLADRASTRQALSEPQGPGPSQAVSRSVPGISDHARLVELTERLHRAIEREKRYPLGARRLGREGVTRVAFRLAPDGAIGELVVAASSGEASLDRAALRAVRDIGPVREAGDYLDAPTPFRVDIAFRMR